MAGLNFNPGAVQPASEGRDVFAEGWYSGYIATTNAEGNKAGTGGFVSAVIKILSGGGEEGEDFVHRLNLWNANAQAVEIAFRDLSAIAWVVGRGTEIIVDVGTAKDMALATLHNVPFFFKLTVEPQKDRTTKAIIPGKFQNQIRGWRDQYGRTPEQVMGNAPQQPFPDLAGTAAQQAAAGPGLPPAPPMATTAPAAPAAPAAPPNAASSFAPPSPPPAGPAAFTPPAPPAATAPPAPSFPQAGATAPALPPAAPPAGQNWAPGTPPSVAPSFVPPTA